MGMGIAATLVEIVSVHKKNLLGRLRQSKIGSQLLQSIGCDYKVLFTGTASYGLSTDNS